MWILAKGFFATPLGWAAIALILGFGWLQNHDKKVVSSVKMEIKEATHDATQKISTAANRSLDKRVRGRQDPTTRND
jgi:hypothetical protein